MKHIIISVFSALLLLFVIGCGEDSPTGVTGDSDNGGSIDRFEGDFAAGAWSSTGITGGSTSIDPESGDTDSLVFAYAVNLNGGGVTQRSTHFKAVAPADGMITLDWHYHGFHAWYQAYVQGELYANSPSGNAVAPLVDQSVFGTFNFSGTASINVYEGMEYGFEIGGRNYDSDSRLLGDLTLSKFRFVPTE